jgi:hypothetical protein
MTPFYCTALVISPRGDLWASKMIRRKDFGDKEGKGSVFFIGYRGDFNVEAWLRRNYKKALRQLAKDMTGDDAWLPAELTWAFFLESCDYTWYENTWEAGALEWNLPNDNEEDDVLKLIRDKRGRYFEKSPSLDIENSKRALFYDLLRYGRSNREQEIKIETEIHGILENRELYCENTKNFSELRYQIDCALAERGYDPLTEDWGEETETAKQVNFFKNTFTESKMFNTLFKRMFLDNPDSARESFLKLFFTDEGKQGLELMAKDGCLAEFDILNIFLDLVIDDYPVHPEFYEEWLDQYNAI